MQAGRLYAVRVKPISLSRLVREAPELAPYADYVRMNSDAAARNDPSLKIRFFRSAGRHLFFERALVEIDVAFQEVGVELLVLKGMALAYLAYPDPGTRPMTDIDLLIRPQDIRRASAQLATLGYQPMEHQREFTEELVRFGGELSFQRTQGPFVDLHWMLEKYERLRGLIRIDEEALRQRAISYYVSDRQFKTPSLEDQLLTLSIHLGLVHRMRGLRWLLDIDLLIRVFSEKIDWPRVMERAKQWGVYRLVCHTLWLSRETFDTPISSEVQLKPVWGSRTPLGQLIFLDRWQDRLQMMKRVFFPSRDWLCFHYRLKRRQAVLLYRIAHPLLVLTGRFR